MSTIDRYRKNGGFLQLLTLIETSTKDKQEKFLNLIASENLHWEQAIKEKMLTLDRVLSWDLATRSEIFPRTTALSLAMLVGSLPSEKAQLILEALPPKEKKSVEFALEGKTVTPGEVAAALSKLFTEVRKLLHDGILKPERFDEKLQLPDNIESLLDEAPALKLVPSEDSLHSSTPHSPSNLDRPTGNQSGPNGSGPSESSPVATGGGPDGPSHNVAEELTLLRRKLVQLTQENQRLSNDNQQMREKLEQIKKIA